MYDITHNPPAPAPLDFGTPRHADSVVDALGPDRALHRTFLVPTLDVAALPTELGLSDQAIRETLTELPSPDR